MRAGLLAGLLAALLGGAAAAQTQVTSAAPESVSVTIYRDGPVDTAQLARSVEWGGLSGLALITETRTVRLPAGRSVVRFRGVAEGALPQSAKVTGVDGLEQNYDFDLLSPGSLIARAVGEPVRRVRTNPETGRETVDRGVLRSAASGVVLEIDGRLEALGCSGLPEKLVFDRVPPSLADKPTLSVMVDSPRAATRTLQLSYLALGLQWSADYVARVRPDGRTLDLTGWITLANAGRTSFEKAPTAVVAGNVSRVHAAPPQTISPSAGRQCWPMDTTTQGEMLEAIVVTGSRASGPPPPPPPVPMPPPPALEQAAPVALIMAEMSELGDYKLYTLPEPTTVAARQTKQVMFLQQEGAAFERVYRVTPVDSGRGQQALSAPAQIVLKLTNTEARGLGRPLPAGQVTVMERASGGALGLAGRPSLRDVPEAAPFELTLGRAFDVTATTRLLSSPTVATGRRRQVVEVIVSNAKTEPVTAKVGHPAYGAFTVPEESLPHMVRNGAPVWTLAVPANGSATVRYTIEFAG